MDCNARKNQLTRRNFDTLAKHYNIAEKALANSYRRFERLKDGVAPWIEKSFLPPDLQNAYLDIFNERWHRIFG